MPCSNGLLVTAIRRKAKHTCRGSALSCFIFYKRITLTKQHIIEAVLRQRILGPCIKQSWCRSNLRNIQGRHVGINDSRELEILFSYKTRKVD
jgi:hypothetical protein